MSDVIVLSDSEDDFQPPSKKLKLNKSNTIKETNDSSNCYIVLDEEDEDKEKDKTKETITIDVNTDEMVVTIKRNGENLLMEKKKITHVLDDVQKNGDVQKDDVDNKKDDNDNKTDQVENDDYTLAAPQNEDNILSSSTPAIEVAILDCDNKDIDEEAEVSNETDPLEFDKENLLAEEGTKIPDTIEEFINACEKHICDDKVRNVFNRKVSSLKQLTLKTTDYVKTEQFQLFLKENLDNLRSMPQRFVECFVNVYNELRAVNERGMSSSCTSEKENRYIARLETSLKLIHKKIRKLEQREVDFDEENESAYIQYSRYKERAVKLYDKYCKVLKMDPHAGKITYNRLDFAKSKYNEFNKALNKTYKNNKKFPTYWEVDKIIRQCNEQKNMNLTENQILSEVKKCFEELGNLMQKRRQMELHLVHNSYLDAEHLRDPAETDPDLNKKLRSNKTQAQNKLNELCEKYVQKQEKGEEVMLSEDSDDSSYKNSDEDD